MAKKIEEINQILSEEEIPALKDDSTLDDESLLSDFDD